MTAYSGMSELRYSSGRIRSIRAKSDDRCWYCGIVLTQTTITIDHVVPSKLGGPNTVENMVACCMACNAAKGQNSVEAFRRVRSRKAQKIPHFTPKQIEYLAAHGIALPTFPITHQFWFEVAGYE